ncbi:MAG TPA: type II toxin-antitoxin system VapC family toxin [Ktedonobacterales bacterium]|nr:type II toxin-antitoxin system VapC family toxin [Ktedonobacterales bacterium]
MPAAYSLDTSALFARYVVRAPGRTRVEGICAPGTQNVIFLAEVTAAELAAALHQLWRGGVLRQKTVETALRLFWGHFDVGDYNVIPVTSALVRRAATLCESQPLRGYDSVQLACAVSARGTLRASAPASPATGALVDPIFVSEVNRLLAAAQAESFVVDSPLSHP